MIHEITVDGFRSLSNFRLEVSPGLNILVGPNGSGKTNVIEFFQFLSFLMTHDLGRAISMSGGAGSVFRKSAGGNHKVQISAVALGATRSYRPRDEDRNISVEYSYSFTVSASAGFDQIYFSEQRLRMRLDTTPVVDNSQPLLALDHPTRSADNWDLDLTLSFSTDLVPGITLATVSDKLFDRSNRSLRLRHALRDIKSGAEGSTLLSDHISSYLSHRAAPSYCCLDAVSVIVEDVEAIITDMVGGEILNIVPWRVKQPEDIATQQGIRSDGSGLAATLYSLERQERPQGQRRAPVILSYRDRLPRRVRIVSFKEIESYLQLVNPTVNKIRVRNDPFDNRIKLSFFITSGHGSIELPVSSMSDGTLKWLALITAILTYRSIFAIEEPENFLHPVMQQEVLNIMREDIRRRGTNTFVIMTTHSETLLNAADPSEVVVVSMVDSRTAASRPRNAGVIRDEIAATGFGLGFYYRTGALDDA